MFGNPTSDFSRVNDMTATYSDSEGGAWAWLDLFSSSFEANSFDSDEPYDLTLTMPETEFGTEGLSGTFDVSGQAVRDATGSFDASFWGPDANDVAGTMTVTGTDIEDGDVTPFVGIGHFQAKR